MNESVNNYLSQADLAKEKGDFQLAERLYRQALDLDKNNVDILHKLALLMISAEQYPVAISMLTQAIKSQTDNPYLYYNLGLAYQQNQDHDAAIHYYKSAIHKKPNFALAYNNIGVAYQHLGSFEEANRYFKEAFNLKFDCVEAYYNYSQSHKFTEKDRSIINDVNKLEQDISRNKSEQIKLNFTLGKIHDDLHNYKQAFDHYKKANSLKYQGFNNQQFDSYIDRIIQYFDGNTCKLLTSIVPDVQKRFVFIVGMPRSGSTLVEQIISSHPVVQSGGEIGFIGDIVDELPELLNSEQSYPECISTTDKPVINAISLKVNAYVNNLNYKYQVITDKSPINFLHIGLIMILFPNSLVIHTQRNALDTCLSCYFQNFDKQHQYAYDLKSLGKFYYQYARLMEHWKDIFPDKIYELQYESLVNDHEQVVKSLINFVQLDWDERCVNFQKTNKIVSTASKWQIRQPIYQTSIGKSEKYRAYLSELISSLEN